MDLKKLTKKQVKKVFKIVGTLSVDVIFNKSKPASFNFGTQEVQNKEVSTVTVKGILDKEDTKKRDSTNQQIDTKRLLFDSDDIKDIDIYTTVVIDGKNYKPVAPILNDGFIATITFNKER